MGFRRLAAIVAVLMSIVGSSAFCQTGSLQGTVKDAAGAVIPDAAVTIQNDATSSSRNTFTSESGAYSISSLPPGTYTVTITKAGFAAATLKGVGISVAQTLPLDATLTVGSTPLLWT